MRFSTGKVGFVRVAAALQQIDDWQLTTIIVAAKEDSLAALA